MKGFVLNVLEKAVTLKAVESVKMKYKRELAEVTALKSKTFMNRERVIVLEDSCTLIVQTIEKLEEMTTSAKNHELDLDNMGFAEPSLVVEIREEAIVIIGKMLSPQTAQFVEVSAES